MSAKIQDNEGSDFMLNRNNGIQYKLYKEKVDRYRKILEVYNKSFNDNPITINDVIEKSLVNLFDNVKNYTLKKCSVTMGTEPVQVWIQKHIYLKMVDLQKEYPEVSYSNIINFALDRYYQPFVIEYTRKILDKTLSIQTNLIKLLEQYKLIEGWTVKGEYIIAQCPNCGTEGFYYGYIAEKGKVFVGCFDDRCIYRNGSRIDIYRFLKEQKNLEYVEVLKEVFWILYGFLV